MHEKEFDYCKNTKPLLFKWFKEKKDAEERAFLILYHRATKRGKKALARRWNRLKREEADRAFRFFYGTNDGR